MSENPKFYKYTDGKKMEIKFKEPIWGGKVYYLEYDSDSGEFILKKKKGRTKNNN